MQVCSTQIILRHQCAVCCLPYFIFSPQSYPSCLFPSCLVPQHLLHTWHVVTTQEQLQLLQGFSHLQLVVNSCHNIVTCDKSFKQKPFYSKYHTLGGMASNANKFYFSVIGFQVVGYRQGTSKVITISIMAVNEWRALCCICHSAYVWFMFVGR